MLLLFIATVKMAEEKNVKSFGKRPWNDPHEESAARLTTKNILGLSGKVSHVLKISDKIFKSTNQPCFFVIQL